MPIVLDHTIVPARDNEASARFSARVFGLQVEAAVSHFAPVRVNERLSWTSIRARHSSPSLCLQGQRSGLRRDLSADQAQRHCFRQRPAVT
jgi:hypothetical protein